LEVKMGKYEPGNYIYELTKPESGGRPVGIQQRKGERGYIVNTQLLTDLQASITEERLAIATYHRRADYARNFPGIAKLYLHIAAEEEHHLQEFSDELRKIQ
jgi:rubrerythrin